MCSSSALTRRIHPLTTPSRHLAREDTRSKRGFLSTLRQVGKNKPEVGSADRRETRAGESLHEQLTKNHGFLVQPTGACAIIGGRGENSLCLPVRVSLAGAGGALQVEARRVGEE